MFCEGEIVSDAAAGRGGERRGDDRGRSRDTRGSSGASRGKKPNGSRDGKAAERKPYERRDGKAPERKPYEKFDSSATGARKPGRSGTGRPGSGKPGEKKLWTSQGAPARGDRDAHRRELELTEEERLARELRSVRPRHDDPEIPSDVRADELDRVARNELKTLSKDNAEGVAQHLVMAARLIDDDPELAHRHALSAARRAGRIAMVRETLAITAYRVGDFALALRELRTFRRISGSNNELPLMVDSERGVGRPDRALELGRSVDRSTLPNDVQVSLAIAMSGARLDQGKPDAALAELEIPQLDPDRAYSYSPDLYFAYAEVLEELGRDAEAAQWRERADRAEVALAAASGADAGGDETIDVFEEDLVLDDQAVLEEAPDAAATEPDRKDDGGSVPQED
jgi:hypothetical protein